MATDIFADDLESILVTEEELKKTVARLAREIEAAYKDSGRPLLVVGVLKGSFVFMADLVRELQLDIEVDFMQASSYGAGTVSSGAVNLRLDLKKKDLTGVDVLVLEDILDTGNTLYFLMDYLRGKGANSVKLCVLLNKPDRRVRKVDADFEGIRIPDAFVVGYGLDYDEKYRSLPYVGILAPKVYEK